jgi:hypothetical protein
MGQYTRGSDLGTPEVNELVEALNDPAKTAELMEKYGWTEDDLLASADMASKRLTAGIANIDCL